MRICQYLVGSILTASNITQAAEGIEIWAVGVPADQRHRPSRALARGSIHKSAFVYGFQRKGGFRLRALGLRDFKQIPKWSELSLSAVTI